MKQTQNLGLKLPEGSDWADVTALNENMEVLDAAVAGKADVGEDGKIPASQLPEMNYDPAGSAAAVQANLAAHMADKNNPHGLDAGDVGARPNTWVPSWNDVTGKPSTFPPSGHTHDTSQIVSGILPAARGGTGVGSIAELASLLAGQGLGKMTVGSYVGTGVMGPSNPNSITCAFPIKAVFMMRIGMLPCGLGYFNKSGSWYYTSIIESMYTAQSGFQQNIGFGHDNSFTKRYAQFSSDRKTVSWYCVYDDATDYPGAQFNEAGEIYEWIAIG